MNRLCFNRCCLQWIQVWDMLGLPVELPGLRTGKCCLWRDHMGPPPGEEAGHQDPGCKGVGNMKAISQDGDNLQQNTSQGGFSMM